MTVLRDDDSLIYQITPKKSAGSQLKRKNLSHNQKYNKKILLEDMLNGHRAIDSCINDIPTQAPVAALSNMGNTCFLNSVLYSLRFVPTFLHNLHHLIEDLKTINNRINQNKVKSSSLGRNSTALSGPSSRSTSSKDLLSLGSNNDIVPKTKVQLVTETLHDLFAVMHNIENSDSRDAYQPNAFLSAVQNANSIFQGNHQQDAHELLVYILDNIRETCKLFAQQMKLNSELLMEKEQNTNATSGNLKFWNKPWGKNNKKNDITFKKAIDELKDGCMRESDDCNDKENYEETGKKKVGYNFVCDDFEGISLIRTKCVECEYVTEHKEPFYDISVPVITKDDVESCIDMTSNASKTYRRACVTREKLCDTNKYLCNNCDRYNEAYREVLFEKLPNVMVLQMKRFMTTMSGVQKVTTYFPTPLELACFCENCHKLEESNSVHAYRLCCVIIHLGGNLASGHYIAYVRASDATNDYIECPHNSNKSGLSASSSEKSINILKSLKYLKTRSANNALLNGCRMDNAQSSGFQLCKSIVCCGIKINNKSIREPDNVWLECDDENIRTISNDEFEDILAYKPNSTSTPYLLFYTKKPVI